MAPRTTRPLTDFRAVDIDVAGGKGAALGELLWHGFPVPPGFVVTTEAYRSFLAETELAEVISTMDPTQDDGGGPCGIAGLGIPLVVRA